MYIYIYMYHVCISTYIYIYIYQTVCIYIYIYTQHKAPSRPFRIFSFSRASRSSWGQIRAALQTHTHTCYCYLMFIFLLSLLFTRLYFLVTSDVHCFSNTHVFVPSSELANCCRLPFQKQRSAIQVFAK